MIFSRVYQVPKYNNLKCNFDFIIIEISKNRQGSHQKVNILHKKTDTSQQNVGSAYAQSPRKCSNIEILAKIEGKV
jgi:hypothetical protein